MECDSLSLRLAASLIRGDSLPKSFKMLQPKLTVQGGTSPPEALPAEGETLFGHWCLRAPIKTTTFLNGFGETGVALQTEDQTDMQDKDSNPLKWHV